MVVRSDSSTEDRLAMRIKRERNVGVLEVVVFVFVGFRATVGTERPRVVLETAFERSALRGISVSGLHRRRSGCVAGNSRLKNGHDGSCIARWSGGGGGARRSGGGGGARRSGSSCDVMRQ